MMTPRVCHPAWISRARRSALVALALLCLALPDAGIFAQASSPVLSGVLAPGSRVRVTEIEGRSPRVGTIRRLTQDSLVIERRNTEQAAYSLAEITRLEVTLRKRTNVRAGMLTGFLGGTIGGYFWGNTQGDDFFFTDEDMALIGAVTFGVLGTAAGGLAGLVWRSDVWQVVDMDNRSGRVQLRPIIDARHVGVGVRLRF